MIESCIPFWINEEEGIDEKVAGQKLFSIAFRCASNQAGALFRLLCKKNNSKRNFYQLSRN